MAVSMIEGFDLYNGLGANTGMAAKWTQTLSGSGNSTSLTTGRFSDQCFRASISTFSAQVLQSSRPITASASVTVGFAFRKSAPGDELLPIMWLLNAANYHVGLALNSNGSLTAGRYTAATTSTNLGSSAAGVITANTWHYIECEITISDTIGVFNVYVDGVSVISLSAQDTRNGATTTVDTLQIGTNRAGSGIFANLDYDDCYVTDTATKLGERRVETRRPAADTAQKDFTPSSGANNFSRVSDTTADGDTTYVQASTVGNTDRYTHAGLSSTPATIDAVQVTSFAVKTDATSRSIALQVKSGATTSDGGNFALAASYGKFDRIIATDPNTAAAWTAAGVNNLEFGPKVTI